MIIVEGADNSGKSTLAKWLSNDLKLPLIHPGGSPKTNLELIQCVNTQWLNSSEDVIYDRVTCISDQMYQHHADDARKRILTLEFEKMIMLLDVHIIYCRPPDSVIFKFENHVKKEHDSPQFLEWLETEHENVVDRYDEFFNQYKEPNVIRYNYVVDDYYKLLKLLGSL